MSQSHGVNADKLAEMAKEVETLVATHKFRLPVRAFMTDQEYKWRYGGPPNYTLANLFYLKGKTMNHFEGSLEQIVEDVVTTWEFERSHKIDLMEHKATDHPNFLIGANGARMFNNVEAQEVGNYNVLLEPAKLENWGKEIRTDWDGSHHVFKDAFAAFAWETLKVFAGPPKVAFTWRHWGHFTGQYKGNKGNGQVINMTGFATASLSTDLKLQVVEIFYSPDDFLETLEGKKPLATSEKAHEFIGPYVPYLERRMKLTPA
jgi:hypothetical protein